MHYSRCLFILLIFTVSPYEFFCFLLAFVSLINFMGDMDSIASLQLKCYAFLYMAFSLIYCGMYGPYILIYNLIPIAYPYLY